MTTPGYPNIAFVGKAGSGKTTAAKLLQQMVLPNTPAMGYERVSFAEPIKDVAEKLWGFGARTDRHKLQALAKALRAIDEDVVLRPWLVEVAAATWPVVNDDLRYANEWWAAKSSGFVIVRVVADHALRVDRLKRNGKLQDESQLNDESETQIDHLTEDYRIYNSGDRFDVVDHLVTILDREAKRR